MIIDVDIVSQGKPFSCDLLGGLRDEYSCKPLVTVGYLYNEIL